MEGKTQLPVLFLYESRATVIEIFVVIKFVYYGDILCLAYKDHLKRYFIIDKKN